MANPIIQNYINDSSIPAEKRKLATDLLNSGAPEDKIAGSITAKYGDIYTPKSRQDANGSEMSVSEFLQKQAADPSFQIGLPKPPKATKNTKQNIINLSSTNNGYDKSLKGRIFNAIQETGSAIKSGAGDIGAGIETLKGANNLKQIANQAALDAQKKLKAGTIDKSTYDKLIKKSNEILSDKVTSTKNLGTSQIVKGAVHTGMSPITGAVAGGAKPELAKLGEKIASGVEGMSPENKEKLKGYMDKMSEMAKDHPALANYLTAGVELVGVGGGTKVASVGGKAAVDTIKNTAKAAAPMVGGVAELGGKLVKDLGTIGGGAVNLGTKLAKEGGEKLKGIKIPGKTSLDDHVTQLLAPEINKKNLKIAAEKGLAVEGSKGIFTGTKDVIKLTPRMEVAKTTLIKHFPNLQKVSSFMIPTKIIQKIGEIAAPLRESFKLVKVPASIKSTLKEDWLKLKNSQIGKSFNSTWLKDIHKTFENDYLDKITKSVKDASGKFRQKNVDDVWNMATDYDKRNSKLVEAIEKGNSDPKVLAQFDSYLENRRLLRKTIDDLSKHLDTIEAQKAFKEMSDLYEAQGAILKNIKPSNKTGNSAAGDLIKGYGKAALVGSIGSTATYAALN